MISRIQALTMFVAARNIQTAEHRGTVSQTEAEMAEFRFRRQRAENVLSLTAKFGGDYKKAAAEYTISKGLEEAGMLTSHHHQPNSQYFTQREGALVEINAVMEGNSVLEEVFADLFQETAVAAIWRAYSNARGFYFLAPFIGGVVLNREDVDWKKASVEQLDTRVQRILARGEAWKLVVAKINAYNEEAEIVGGMASYGGRSLAEDCWATVNPGSPWEACENIAKLAIPGTPGTDKYSCFWHRLHNGDENIAKILACLYRHLPGLKQSMKGFLREYPEGCLDWAKEGVAFVLA